MKSIRGVILAEDEVLIREYEASYIENPKSEGYVIATNRRLIFTGSTATALGSSILVRDTKIDSITGISGGLTQKKSIIQIIIGLIIGLIGLRLVFDTPVFGMIILAIGGFIGYKGFNASGVQMYINILSSQSSPSISVAVEASRGWFSRITGNDAIMTVAASGPGRNTEQMIREISALIQDIQIMGDLAIKKWSNEELASNPIPEKASTKEQFSSVVGTVKSTASKVKDTALTVTENLSEDYKKSKENKQVNKEIEKKTCTCGTDYNDGAEFCIECGAKLDLKQENIFG